MLVKIYCFLMLLSTSYFVLQYLLLEWMGSTRFYCFCCSKYSTYLHVWHLFVTSGFLGVHFLWQFSSKNDFNSHLVICVRSSDFPRHHHHRRHQQQGTTSIIIIRNKFEIEIHLQSITHWQTKRQPTRFKCPPWIRPTRWSPTLTRSWTCQWTMPTIWLTEVKNPALRPTTTTTIRSPIIAPSRPIRRRLQQRPLRQSDRVTLPCVNSGCPPGNLCSRPRPFCRYSSPSAWCLWHSAACCFTTRTWSRSTCSTTPTACPSTARESARPRTPLAFARHPSSSARTSTRPSTCTTACRTSTRIIVAMSSRAMTTSCLATSARSAVTAHPTIIRPATRRILMRHAVRLPIRCSTVSVSKKNTFLIAFFLL